MGVICAVRSPHEAQGYLVCAVDLLLSLGLKLKLLSSKLKVVHQRQEVSYDGALHAIFERFLFRILSG